MEKTAGKVNENDTNCAINRETNTEKDKLETCFPCGQYQQYGGLHWHPMYQMQLTGLLSNTSGKSSELPW